MFHTYENRSFFSGIMSEERWEYFYLKVEKREGVCRRIWCWFRCTGFFDVLQKWNSWKSQLLEQIFLRYYCFFREKSVLHISYHLQSFNRVWQFRFTYRCILDVLWVDIWRVLAPSTWCSSFALSWQSMLSLQIWCVAIEMLHFTRVTAAARY